jgi:hypothetical protein
VDDWSSLPVAPESFDLASAWLLLADLRERCYEAHRVLTAPLTPACHIGADATNVLTAAKPLDNAAAAILTELAKESPTAVAGESDGLLLGAAMFGCTTPGR